MATTYAIPDGKKHFDAVTYTANAGTQSLTTQFAVDFAWLKSRSNAYSHTVYDRNRGALQFLGTSNTAAEATSANSLTSFNSNGVTLGNNENSNLSGSSIAWLWKAGGTAVSNTAGSITSSVSANPTAGFSVVTYTGTGANATVGHGLGVAPSMVIVKNRNSAGFNWVSWHIGLTSGAYYINLNTTAAQGSDATVWNSTVPTSSVFSIGTSPPMNTNGNTQVAYCFAPVSGYSAFGKYTGNGSADGPFVFLGFRPRLIMIKRSDAVGNWEVLDSSRNPSNAANFALYPNLSNAEDTSPTDDFLSNGFKIRTATDSNQNTNGGTYIYMAFAENPFKYANAR